MINLDPKELFVAYREKNLDKDSTINYLRAFIEECDEEKKRIKGIFFLSKIESGTNGKILRILENSLLSDQSSLVRAFAARMLVKNSPIQNVSLVEYVIDNDISVLVTTTIFKTLKKIRYYLAKGLRNKIVAKYAKLHGVIPIEAKFLVVIRVSSKSSR